ncbi:MAG: VWA domain-containing protein [Acidobacteriota bacterium]
MRRLGVLVAGLSALLASGLGATAEAPEAELDLPTDLSQIEGADPYTTWLEEVAPLITVAEQQLFASLTEDYQRDAFIDKFWRVRDPYPRTTRNELAERWPLRVAEARGKWGDLADARARMLLVHGPPDRSFEVRCTETHKPAEVWAYQGTDWTNVETVLIFLREQAGRGKARIWQPGLVSADLRSLATRARSCFGGRQLLALADAIANNSEEYAIALRRLLAKPRPSSTEWVDAFRVFSTEIADDAPILPARIDLAYPGRHQQRTVVQGLLRVPAGDAGIGEYAGYRSHDFRVVGEVLQDGELFETFRYRYGFPVDTAPSELPMSFQRYLRPGPYRLIVKLEDLNSDSVFRHEQDLDVPRAETRIDLPTFKDPETEALFAEATAAVAAGETGIRIVPPRSALLTGFVRFDTLVSGDEISKVRFFLDDKMVVAKNRAPYSVEIDLGEYPDLHTLRVEALDATGSQVASDELLINSGGYRFIAKLREPRPGARYDSSLRARVEVEVPDGRSLDRVELYLDETLVATLYQEPFVHPIVLPRAGQVAYVRAVAYLPDGNSTEDLVFINAPNLVDEIDVQMVELYTTVLDSQGRPVSGLARDSFRVLEDETPQTIARFEEVEDLPIHVGVLIDNSASMADVLSDVRFAALDFLDQAVQEKDRAAIITFANFPRLAVELTNDRNALGAGLAGLAPEGRTALYDSLMFSLYYFTGVRGQRAILVLSDGRDESSRFSFDDTLEYARRAGITVYTIGLRLGDPGARRKLGRLADETGGRAFFLRDIADLSEIYSTIQSELRSQLLITYQSSNTSSDEAFRRIELKVDDPRAAEVKTLSGYYP